MVNTALFGRAEQSGTQNTISTGVKTFILDVDNAVIDVDYTVQIVPYAEADAWMYGVVTAKDGLEVTVSVFKTSFVEGTYRNWSLQVITGPFAGLPASQTLGFSTDSQAVPTVGDKLDWTIEPGKAFYDNSTIYVSAVNDSTVFFFATVVDYDSVDGSISLVVNRVSGSGTFDLWALSLIDVTQSFFTAVGDTNYTVRPSDRVVALTTALTTDRTWTLPLAASVPTGYTLTLMDTTGSVSTVNRIIAARAGSDLLNSVTTLAIGRHPFFSVVFNSNGVDRWIANPPSYGSFQSDVFLDGDVFISAPVQINNDLEISDELTVGTDAVIGGLLTVGSTELKDSTTTFFDNADDTKQLRFQLSGIATGTLRTVTWPDADLTVVGLTTTQTLTNKTLTSPAIDTPTITTPEINGLATVDALRSFSLSIDDDTAVLITPPNNSAFMLAFVTTTSLGATAPAGTIGGRTNTADAPDLIAANNSTNIEFSTATLTGTTGTDGKLTFSCPGDGNIYIENRLGAQRLYRFTLLCN